MTSIIEIIHMVLETVGEIFLVLIGVLLLLMCIFGGKINVTINGINKFFQ